MEPPVSWGHSQRKGAQGRGRPDQGRSRERAGARPAGPREQFRWWLPLEGAAPFCLWELRPWEHNSSSLGPGSQGTKWTQSRVWRSPSGQAEAGRAQDEDSPATGCPKAVLVSMPATVSIPASGDWGGERGCSRAGELAAAVMVVPPGVTLCLR